MNHPGGMPTSRQVLEFDPYWIFGIPSDQRHLEAVRLDVLSVVRIHRVPGIALIHNTWVLELE